MPSNPPADQPMVTEADDRTVSFDVRQRLERIANSGANPGSNRNMMLTPYDACVILARLPSQQSDPAMGEVNEALLVSTNEAWAEVVRLRELLAALSPPAPTEPVQTSQPVSVPSVDGLSAFEAWWEANKRGGGEWVKRAAFVAGYEAAPSCSQAAYMAGYRAGAEDNGADEPDMEPARDGWHDFNAALSVPTAPAPTDVSGEGEDEGAIADAARRIASWSGNKTECYKVAKRELSAAAPPPAMPSREVIARTAFKTMHAWESWEDYDSRREARGGYHPQQEVAFSIADAILSLLTDARGERESGV